MGWGQQVGSRWLNDEHNAPQLPRELSPAGGLVLGVWIPRGKRVALGSERHFPAALGCAICYRNDAGSTEGGQEAEAGRGWLVAEVRRTGS